MDKYKMVKMLGKGGFGEAHLAKSKVDGRQYCIKKINVSRMSPKEIKEAMNEISVLSSLTKHPCIVTYRESFLEKGFLCIVMDFAEGGDLHAATKKQRGRPFKEDQVLDWFVQICLAIKHVHDRKILHRDIKAQNIFLTSRNMIRVGDFGISKVLTSTGELAKTAIGTPYYLSPEICQEKPYDQKSDVWALGCLLYEMLTLKHAFEGNNMRGLVVKILRGVYPPINTSFSKNVRDLVAKMLAKDPRRRPTIGQILRYSFIKERIHKFLSQTLMGDEFSHTMIHRPSPAIQIKGVVRDPKEILRKLKVAHEKRIALDAPRTDGGDRIIPQGKENVYEVNQSKPDAAAQEAQRKNQQAKDRAAAQAREKEQEERARRMKEHEERIRLERRRRVEAKRRADAAESELKAKKAAEAKAKIEKANRERQEKLDRERRERIKRDRIARAKREADRKMEAERLEAEKRARDEAVAAKRADRLRREKEQRDKAARAREENARALEEKMLLRQKEEEEQRVAAAAREEARRKRAEEIGNMATVKLSVLQEDEVLEEETDALPGAAYPSNNEGSVEKDNLPSSEEEAIPDEGVKLPGAEMSMMRRLENFKKPAGEQADDQIEAPNNAEATMLRRLGAFKQKGQSDATDLGNDVAASDAASDPAAATMLKRLEKFKVARLALNEVQPEPLSPGGLAKERMEREKAEAEMVERVQRFRHGEKKGISTFMLEVNGIQDANRAAMQRSPRNSPRNNLHAPMSPRAERDQLRQRARSARDAEEQAAKQRVQEAKRKKELVIERKQEMKQNAAKPGASVYERRQAQKVEQLQAAHAAEVAREEKLIGWRAKQQEKKEAKEREEQEHRMRVVKMRENNARRESDVKDLIKKARAEAAGVKKVDEEIVVAVAQPRRMQPPASVVESEELVARRLQRDEERNKIREQRKKFMARQNNEQPDFELVLEPAPQSKPTRPTRAASAVPFEMVLKPEQEVIQTEEEEAEDKEEEEVEEKEEEEDVFFVNDRQAVADAAADPDVNVVLAGSLWTEEAGAEVQHDEYEIQSKVEVADVLLAEAANDKDSDQVHEAEDAEPEWSREDDEYLELVETMRDALVEQNDDMDIIVLEDEDVIVDDQQSPPDSNMDKIGRLVHGGQTLRLPNVTDEDSLTYQIESLRVFLEEKLGDERFIEVYRLLESMGNNDDEDAVTKQVAGLLGPDWKEPFQMVVRLLLCEDQLNR